MPEEGGIGGGEGPGEPPPSSTLGFRTPRFGIIGPAYSFNAGSINGSANLSCQASIGASSRFRSAAPFSASAEMSATGGLQVLASSSLTSSADMSATGNVQTLASSNLTSTADMSAVSTYSVGSGLSAIASLSATPSPISELLGASYLNASASMSTFFYQLCPCPDYGMEQTISDTSKRPQDPVAGSYKRKGCG